MVTSTRLNRILKHLGSNNNAPVETVDCSAKAKPKRAPRQLPTPNGDYLNLDALLTAEERAHRATARKFAEEHIAPVIDGYMERAEFPMEIVKKMSGVVPSGGSQVGYGCAGMSVMSSAMVAMELSRVNGSMSTFYVVHSDIAMMSISMCGSEAQKAKYLPKMASFESLGSFALTEPEIGSDATNVRTTATPVSSPKKGFIINGKKRWIGNATVAGVIIVWAKNSETGQVNGFIVEKNSPGMTITKIENKIAMRCVQNADIVLDNVFVPEENRLTMATNFQNGPGKVLHVSRVLAAWAAVGTAIGAYEKALSYLQRRQQFGAPLASFQLVQEKLVRILSNIQSMIMLAWRVTRLLESGKVTPGMSSLSKAHNTLRGRECVFLARELLGGNGVITDYGVASSFVDMEAVYTFEGTYEVNALVTGREVTGFSAFK